MVRIHSTVAIAGPSLGFSGGKAKNQRGGTFLNYSIGYVQQLVAKLEMGARHHWPPRWRRP